MKKLLKQIVTIKVATGCIAAAVQVDLSYSLGGANVQQVVTRLRFVNHYQSHICCDLMCIPAKQVSLDLGEFAPQTES